MSDHLGNFLLIEETENFPCQICQYGTVRKTPQRRQGESDHLVMVHMRAPIYLERQIDLDRPKTESSLEGAKTGSVADRGDQDGARSSE